MNKKVLGERKASQDENQRLRELVAAQKKDLEYVRGALRDRDVLLHRMSAKVEELEGRYIASLSGRGSMDGSSNASGGGGGGGSGSVQNSRAPSLKALLRRGAGSVGSSSGDFGVGGGGGGSGDQSLVEYREEVGADGKVVFVMMAGGSSGGSLGSLGSLGGGGGGGGSGTARSSRAASMERLERLSEPVRRREKVVSDGIAKTELDWVEHRAKQTPGAGSYELDNAYQVTGGKFNMSKAKSEVG